MENCKWLKYTFVCPECDSYVEYTIKDIYKDNDNFFCSCGGSSTLLSVVDATIPNVTQKKEEKMITETPAQTMTLDWIENDVTTTKIYTESIVRELCLRSKELTNKQNDWYRKESQLRTLLEEVYADSNEQETLAQIAEIFDVPLTKEISVTAYVEVQMTVQVDMADGMVDSNDNIYDLVRKNLTVDSYDSEIYVNNYDVERVEVN